MVGRSQFVSNQIARMSHDAYFIGDGTTKVFTLANSVYYSDEQTASDTAEVEVKVNGLRVEKIGEIGEYGMTKSDGLLKVITFKAAPLSNDIIQVRYRPGE